MNRARGVSGVVCEIIYLKNYIGMTLIKFSRHKRKMFMKHFKWLISLSLATGLALGVFAQAAEVEAEALQATPTQEFAQVAEVGIEAILATPVQGTVVCSADNCQEPADESCKCKCKCNGKEKKDYLNQGPKCSKCCSSDGTNCDRKKDCDIPM